MFSIYKHNLVREVGRVIKYNTWEKFVKKVGWKYKFKGKGNNV